MNPKELFSELKRRNVYKVGVAYAVVGWLLVQVATQVFPLFAAVLTPLTAWGADSATRPNIIFILIDDLRWDEVDYPFVKIPNIQRIAREGVRFRNAFVTTPLCSPSRASYLTGQYAHKHGITDNTDHSTRSHELVTFLRLLHEAGYDTAFLGKWHMGVDDNPRPGIDHWVSVKGQGSYIDPEFNVNGRRETKHGYFSDILNEYALDFLKQKHKKPFLLYLSHKAVHPDLIQYADGSVSDLNGGKFIPAERHKNLYADAQVPHRPNYAKPPDGKPSLLRQIGHLPPLGPKTVTTDETIRNRLRVLASVEDGVAEIFKTLEDQKQLDNTLIIFTSDEGYFYGEHGLSVERRLAYEESIRIPLFMRWPKLIKAGSPIYQFALNIDIAPTLLEVGGAPVPKEIHGRSLVPLLRAENVPWRDSFLIEYFSDKVFPRISRMGYQAVRNERWKYIHYVDLDGTDELYDLKADPYEMNNLAARSQAAETMVQMRRKLQQLGDSSK
jgi:arylsulfatase A-like enzyme